jgi:hypothetical protein
MNEFILRQSSVLIWHLYTKDGVDLVTFYRCDNRQDAERQARAWASTWSNVTITVKEDNNEC